MINLFDVIGPVMVGPSSSHTAGAIRLGLLARAIAGFQPAKARIKLHGSFGETGRGHGTDLGLTAGLLGWATDDTRLAQVAEHAATAGLAVSFERADLGRAHPNTARMELGGAGGERAVIQGSSLGGGAVLVTHLDGASVELQGLYDTLLISHRDRPGVLAGITAALAACGINIATMRVSREAKGGTALTTLELDQEPPAKTITALESQVELLRVRKIPRL